MEVLMGRLIAVFMLAYAALADSATAQVWCRVLDPELAGVFEGGCKDGLADGQGVARGKATYRGEFKAGRKHGHGTKTWRSGDRYEGEFFEDRRQGQGTYTWGVDSEAPGDKYEGTYVADLRDGLGTYTFASGGVYVGQWAKDEMAGPLTRELVARAHALVKARAALSAPGRIVCREMRVGISERDVIRGSVIEVDRTGLRIMVEGAGRFVHVVNGARVERGAVLRDDVLNWIPCL